MINSFKSLLFFLLQTHVLLLMLVRPPLLLVKSQVLLFDPCNVGKKYHEPFPSHHFGAINHQFIWLVYYCFTKIYGCNFSSKKQTVYAGHLREEMARNTALATYEEGELREMSCLGVIMMGFDKHVG